MQLGEINTFYALGDPDERRRRRERLRESHIVPLTDYVEQLRKTLGHNQEIPYFDPCDGGINAKLLFLLEAPGPKAVSSGFISRDNPDPTARSMTQISSECGIPREETISWNIVPWYVGSEGRIRPVTKEEIDAGIQALKSLQPLLPNLRVVVLMGCKAQSAQSKIEIIFQTKVLTCPHPSPRVFRVWPAKREEIKSVFLQAFDISLRRD